MSSWMNEAAAPTHNGNNTFPHINDPNVTGAMMDPSAYMGSPAQFNPAQFANNPQLAMQNGPMRNASPSFQNSVYQTNPVIPSKRPRPPEDNMTGSPRHNPGMLPASRAETPQQQQQAHFASFQQTPMPQQNSGQPSPYPHLQSNGSANASPSPVMGQMRPQSVPGRGPTASPHPFSPASAQFGAQASPVPSEQGTPQPNPYMQNSGFPQGFNPNFPPQPSPVRPSPSPNMMQNTMGNPQMMAQMNQMAQQLPPQMQQQMAQMQQMGQMPPHIFQKQLMTQARSPAEQQQQQQQLAYQMQFHRQMQQNNMQQMGSPVPAGIQGAQGMQGMQGMGMPGQAMAAGRGMMPKQPGPMANGQMPPGNMRPQQGQSAARGTPEQFMKQLTIFMNQRQLPLETNPVLHGRQINLGMLFQHVSKYGGYVNATQSSGWPHILTLFGLNPMQIPTAPQELKSIYERNLYKFEQAWQTQQKQRMMHQQQQQQHQTQQQPQHQQQHQPQPQIHQPHQHTHQQAQQPPGQPPQNQGQQLKMAQAQMVPGHMGHPGQQGHPTTQTPIKQMQKQMSPDQPGANGFPTPQQAHAPPQPPIVAGHSRNSFSRSQPTPTQDKFSAQSPAQSIKSSMVRMPAPRPAVSGHHKFPMGLDDEEYVPGALELIDSQYGGLDLIALEALGKEMGRLKPDVPPLDELGDVNIHALTRSLQSGIHGEVRLALDTLATLTRSEDPSHLIELNKCEDLLDVLIECAEDQVEMLAEDTEQDSDEILLKGYEDIARACRLGAMAVCDIPRFGSTAYNLDRAVDRLICITTVLRNLSFCPDNHQILADESVVKFLCVVIRYLGTRQMLLRTNKNTLDFMKDIVTFLSNVAGSVDIPGREQALCLLQFLLAFMPSPAASMASETVYFSPYEPALHPYLPAAVDSLAKLLARDEPNRTYYKAIFSIDGANSPPYELLTKTFALAVAAVPDQTKDTRPGHLPPLIETRKPFLMQGLLAADIVASMVPGYESGVATAWLASGNGFAQNLFRLVRALCYLFEPQKAPNQRSHSRKDTELVYLAVLGVSILRKLAIASRDPNNPDYSIPPNALPSPESVLGALQMQSMEWTKEGLLEHLVAYASLADGAWR